MNGSVYMNLGDAKLSDLSPQIQEALKNSKPGEAARRSCPKPASN